MKYTEIRLVKQGDHYQIRFVGERPDNNDEMVEAGGVLFEVYHVDEHYVLSKITNGDPFKVCNTIEELIMFLRDKTGLMLKQDIE